MSHREPDSAIGGVRIKITRRRSTHLAGVTIAFQHQRASLLRDFTCERGLALQGFKDIFTGLQIRAIIVREYRIAFLVPKLPQTPPPFAGIVTRRADLVAGNNLPDIGFQKPPYACF